MRQFFFVFGSDVRGMFGGDEFFEEWKDFHHKWQN